MSDVVICAEGLGKRYLIGHQSAERERYTALRDVVGRSLKGLGRSALDMMRGRQIVAGDEIEEFWALKDVSFEIKRGEVVGIIGRNGAGKSTLLKILSRITEPSEGRVQITGRVASLLEVGTGFHPELTGRENIYLNGAILGMSRAEIKKNFDEIVAFAEVEKFLDTPVKRYSSGMYVRLAFAVAAHLEPDILIIDEVLAVGDAEFQKKCLGKMQDVADRGRTVLFVSHNMDAIQRLCQTAFVLERGKPLTATGVSDAVASYLSSSFTSEIASYRDPRYRNSGELISVEMRPNPTRVTLRIHPKPGELRDFSLVVHDSRQNPLFTTQLTDRSVPVSTSTGLQFSVQLPIEHLRTDRYFISFASFSPSRSCFYDLITHYPIALTSVHTPSTANDQRWGSVYFSLDWQMENELKSSARLGELE